MSSVVVDWAPKNQLTNQPREICCALNKIMFIQQSLFGSMWTSVFVWLFWVHYISELFII